MPNQPAPPAEGRGMNLSHAFTVIWRRKGLIIGGTLLAVVGAALFNASLPKAYRATVSIGVSQLETFSLSSVEFQKSVIVFFRSHALAIDALQKFGLNKPPFNLTPGPFLRRNLNVQLDRQTGLTNLIVELPNPVLAWKVANHIAREGNDRYAGFIRKELLQNIKYIEEQLNKSLVRQQKAQEALTSFRRKANRSNLTGRLFYLQERNGKLDEMIFHADIDAASKEAEILALEGASDVSTIEAQLTRSKAEYASLKRRELTMRKNKRAIQTEIDSIPQKLAQINLKEEELRNQLDLANKQRERYERRLTKKKDSMELTGPRIRIMNTGGIPEAPVRPRILAWTALSGAVALSLFICLAFLMEQVAGLRDPSRTPKHS